MLCKRTGVLIGHCKKYISFIVSRQLVTRGVEEEGLGRIDNGKLDFESFFIEERLRQIRERRGH